MQEKELEKILQEKADQTKIRSFEEVWQDIKGEIEVEKVAPKKSKKLGWKKWLSLSMASCVIIVALILTPILLTKPSEELFYSENLDKHEVSVEDMFNGLSDADINHLDLSCYTIYETLLYITKDNVIKDAEIKLYSENIILFLAEMKIYAKDVDLNLSLERDYETTYKVNSANVYYKFKQQNSGLYYYNIYAVCNDVQYVIEYTGFSDNITEFLNSFFA